MNTIIETYFPWIIVGIAILAIYWVIRIRSKRENLKCPQCQQLFGKKAAKGIQPYHKHQILDGPIFNTDELTGRDGFIIHCDNCDIDVIYDKKNNPIKI